MSEKHMSCDISFLLWTIISCTSCTSCMTTSQKMYTVHTFVVIVCTCTTHSGVAPHHDGLGRTLQLIYTQFNITTLGGQGRVYSHIYIHISQRKHWLTELTRPSWYIVPLRKCIQWPTFFFIRFLYASIFSQHSISLHDLDTVCLFPLLRLLSNP